MERKRSVALLSVVVAAVVLASYAPRVDAQRSGRATDVNWPLHNLDLAGSRFSTLDQINTRNVKALTPRWLFQYGIIDGVSNQTTPRIVFASGTSPASMRVNIRYTKLARTSRSRSS